MKLKLVLNSLKSDRRELDVPVLLSSGLGLILALVVYAVVFPFKQSYVGILLYERGFTQMLVILFAGFVVAFLGFKLSKIQRQFGSLAQEWLPPSLSAIAPDDNSVLNLQHNLSKENNLLARRCSRVLGAYLYSQSRQVATEFALEDSAFYQSNSESSYALPRILIWAIPLLGFIGTVMGISAAVNGFSGFLEQSSDIDQIKEGIGTVTSGLAVAFDTTLLALLISVMVMIPLALVERLESRLLLRLDIYINDKILPRLQDGEGQQRQENLRQLVNNAVKTALPSPESLVQPAQAYAEQAAQALATGFLAEISAVQGMVRELVTGLNQSHESMREQSMAVNQQLEKTAIALEDRVGQLVAQTAQINEVAQLQATLAKTLRTLKEKETLEEVLVDVHKTLATLQPGLERLNKPRRITLVERDENDG